MSNKTIEEGSYNPFCTNSLVQGKLTCYFPQEKLWPEENLRTEPEDTPKPIPFPAGLSLYHAYQDWRRSKGGRQVRDNAHSYSQKLLFL